jgi:hypothetical protein
MLSIIGVVLFALTQYLTEIIVLLDYLTIVHMALVIAQIVLFKIFKNMQATNDKEDEKTEITEIYNEETDIIDEKTLII